MRTNIRAQKRREGIKGDSLFAWRTHPGFALPADPADFRGLVVDHKKGEIGALVEICGLLRATASQKLVSQSKPEIA
jgi:hypothetical protein